MANTVISLKKSATPSAVPTSLANGEIAINYADGILYYKAANGTISSITGVGNYFGVVNANGTLILSDTTGDVFSILPGDFITITGDAINDRITIGANLKSVYDVANSAFAYANGLSVGSASEAFNAANQAGVIANAAFGAANNITFVTNAFSFINVAGQNTVSATDNDTLTLVSGNNINITTNSVSKTIVINSTGSGDSGRANADYGFINVSTLYTTQDFGSL